MNINCIKIKRKFASSILSVFAFILFFDGTISFASSSIPTWGKSISTETSSSSSNLATSSMSSTSSSTSLTSAALSNNVSSLSETPFTVSDNPLNLTSGGAILIEQNSGDILYNYKMHEKLRPASVTKVMTLLLIMEALDSNQISLTDKVPCTEDAAKMGGS